MDDLNQRQIDAISHRDGPAETLAGPGTGKTRVITYRAKMLIEDGVFPGNLYAMTFTRKATGAMRSRIALLIDDEAAHQMEVTTFASLALRIKQSAVKMNGGRLPEVADQEDCYGYLKRALQELKRDIPPAEARTKMDLWKRGDRSTPFVVLEPEMGAVYQRYNEILKVERKLDISDLIWEAVLALETNEDLARVFHNQVQYLMVDEFQDTSELEYRFMKSLLGDNQNLFVVRAPAQTIYSWRGVKAGKVYDQFKADYPIRKVFVLRICYRSGPSILAVNASMVPEEREVHLISERQASQVIVHEAEDNVAEVNLVAEVINDLVVRDGLSFKHFAVLFRTWSQAGTLEGAFANHGIPYTIAGDRPGHYQTQEVRALFGYLWAALSLADEEIDTPHGILDILINTPPRGIGPRSIKMIRGASSQIRWVDMMRVVARKDLRPQVQQEVGKLFTYLSDMSRLVGTLRPNEMIARVIQDLDWEKTLETELGGRSVLRTMRAFQTESSEYPTVAAFVATMRKRMGIRMDGDQGVAITSVHASKGLEWPVTFVIGFNQGTMPSSQSLSSGDISEERRLAHVALSRAHDLLFVTWSRFHIGTDGRVRDRRPSQFIGRFPHNQVELYEPGCIRPVPVPEDEYLAAFEGTPESDLAY